MIDDNKLKVWMITLGNLATVLNDAKIREDWPSDEDAEVELIIGQISEKLDELKVSKSLEALAQVDDQTLLGVLAMFSFPRAVRMLQIIGEISSSKLTGIMNKRLITDDISAKYLNILYARVRYLAKTHLLFRLFNTERSHEIVKGIIALNEKKD
ncbi:hypothetical protein OCF84_20585 (plasmid) [Shewanella xiamenensis]|uniref:Flagellar motor switch protein FliG C-terminal domain-containing protein n=1 Tax=Shewanella xiamenensis TaxID=332186 RepID=A0ABT6UFT4_9GAMM|nr:hypothetical protein [Shewanella xiamenensis]MDI5833333.1 hypothetical protein [Shewanella xiamenensis]WHF57915.1 hypothetical protein OCF84_20585 [Shewanella xiamenensis]